MPASPSGILHFEQNSKFFSFQVTRNFISTWLPQRDFHSFFGNLLVLDVSFFGNIFQKTNWIFYEVSTMIDWFKKQFSSKRKILETLQNSRALMRVCTSFFIPYFFFHFIFFSFSFHIFRLASGISFLGERAGAGSYFAEMKNQF